MTAAAPASFHAPKMDKKYSGYPKWPMMTRTYSIRRRSQTDPAAISKTTMKVEIQNAMVRIQYERPRVYRIDPAGTSDCSG
jgi:hypothetical protein